MGRQHSFCSRLRLFRPPRAGLLLALLLAVYIATSLHVLRQASGLPFISDNVESYSNLVHATNLYTRGIGKSFGLTDETYGVRPDAPTVVYTHQGNFPRLYALLLYVLGLDTVEKQILATLATVGLATIVLAFITLAKLTTPGFAFIAVVLLQTNYVYVVQWHFDTFRAWHGLLLFSTLLLAYLSTTRTPLWRPFCVTNFLVCFYFETIFALFLSFLYLSVSTLVGKRDLADLLHRGWPLALGACLGSGVLVLQDVAYLGWEGFFNDLYFTYRIRNYSNTEYTNQLELLESFYRDNSIVYWYINIQDASGLLHPAALVRMHMSFIVALLPPVLIFIVFLNTACWCLRIAMAYSSSALGKHLKKPTLAEIQAFLVAVGAATALLLPLLAFVVFAYPMATRSWPFLFLSFLPLTFIGFRIVASPATVSSWAQKLFQSGHKSGRPFRLAALVVIILLVPPSLVLIRTPPDLGALGAWAPAALWLSRSVAFGALVLLGVAWHRPALIIRSREPATQLQYAHSERAISHCGATVLLIGLTGMAFSALANQWIAATWLPVLLVVPVAATYATCRFAARCSSAFAIGRIEDSRLQNERLLFHCLAALYVSPLVVLAMVPALKVGRSGFMFIELLLVLVLMSVLAVILREHVRESTLSAISDLNTAISIRVVAQQWFWLFLFGLPPVLLHVSMDADVVARYSYSYIFVIAVFGTYLVSFALMSLFPARLISFVRGAKRTWASLKAPLVMLLLVSPVALLLEALWSFLNVADSSARTNAYRVIVFAGCTSGALAMVVAAIKLAYGRTSGYSDLSFAKVLLATALMAMAYWACAKYPAVFGPEAVDIWKVMPASTFAPRLYWLMSAISIVLALTIVFKVDLGGGVAQVPKELRGIGMLLAGCTVSYAVVFLFSPGYIFSAYFARWSIFPSFLWLLLVAATVYSLFRAGSVVAGDALTNTRDPVYGLSAGTFSSTKFWNSSSLIKLGLSWSGGAVGLLMLGIYGATQLSLVKALPPDHYSFLPILGKAPYRGKSFVMDNYAAPVTTYTREWAYFDPQFPARELLLESDGFKVRRDMRHLWSRDQLENAAYKKPDYFLCMRPQTPINGAILKNIRGERFGCSSYPIAIHALVGADEVFAHRIQDWDDARDSWMIIKLDWTYPPHLRDDPSTGKWLEVSGKRRGGRTELKVSYQYAHQDGLPEQRSIIRVYQSPRASSCDLDHHNREVIASSEGGRSITLPPEIRGTFVVSVTPMAANKYGAEYFSEEITIPGSDLEQLGHCSYHNAPTNILNALAQIQAGYVSASWNAVDYATDYYVELRKNKGSWFLADVVSLPQLSLELPDAEGAYEMRVLPCNGRVCGGYSRPTKIMYAPPSR